MSQVSLQATAFNAGILGSVPKGKSGKYLVDDLKACLTDYIKRDRGDQFLLDLQSKKHVDARARKGPTQKEKVCRPYKNVVVVCWMRTA